MSSIWEKTSPSEIYNNKYCCKFCNTKLDIKPSVIKNNKTKIFFCNSYCRKTFLKNRNDKELKDNTVECFYCKNKVSKKAYDLNRSNTHFCSRNCFLEYENTRCEKLRKNVSCIYCNKKYKLSKSKIDRDRNIGNFCSQKCLSNYRDSKVNFNCDFCDKKHKTHKSTYDRAVNHFCSKKCASRYYCGKNLCEGIFEKTVKKTKIKYERNNREILNGLELDFYFPNIKLAVEINGPSHYEPIYGEKSLKQQKKRDRTKKKLCKIKNITLFVISVLDVKVKDYERLFSSYIRKIRKHYDKKRRDS